MFCEPNTQVRLLQALPWVDQHGVLQGVAGEGERMRTPGAHPPGAYAEVLATSIKVGHERLPPCGSLYCSPRGHSQGQRMCQENHVCLAFSPPS